MVEVFPIRIAIIGISLGGYFAVLAAAFDERLSACILNDGVFDLSESFIGKYRNSPLEAIVSRTNSDLVNVAMLTTMGLNTSARWAFTHGLWTFGANTPFELLQKCKEFTLKGIANKIKCPTLVMESQEDVSFPGQPKISCHVHKNIFYLLQKRGVGNHCHVAALSLANQRIFDWFDELWAAGSS